MELSRQEQVILAILAQLDGNVRYPQRLLYGPVFGATGEITPSMRSTLSQIIGRLLCADLVRRLNMRELLISDKGRDAAVDLPFNPSWMTGERNERTSCERPRVMPASNSNEAKEMSA